MPKISIIIVNFNSGARLARCLECLRQQSFTDFETIVIDNLSADDSIEKVQLYLDGAKLISSEKNLGFAAANNRAAKQAEGDWLVFLNPDAYARPDWLEKLLSAADRYSEIDAFGSTQIDAHDSDKIDGAGDVYHILGFYYRGHFGWPASSVPDDGECFSPCAAAAMYRRTVFEELGGFDESFFCYGEDVDLGFRLRLTGGGAVQVSDAVVLHEGSGITGRHSDFTIYHGNRNRIWVAYKNIPGTIYWPLFPLQVLADLYLLARYSTIGKGKVYWRALLDGYGNLRKFSEVRRQNHRTRKARLSELLSIMAWSPQAIVTRKAYLKPIKKVYKIRRG